MVGDLALRPEAQQLINEHKDSPKAIFQKTDVTSWKDISALFKTAEEQFGSFDIVCPGAGIFEPPMSAFWHPPGSELSKDDPLGDGYKSIDINLVHPIRSTQLAISHFLASNPPPSSDNPKTVVHIASIAGEMAFTPVPLYITTKWGLRGFIYSLAEIEETRNIRVAGVAPAIVRTPMWLETEKRNMIVSDAGKEQDDWTTPEEVAEVVSRISIDDFARLT